MHTDFYGMFPRILNKKDPEPVHISKISSSIRVFLLASYSQSSYNWEQSQSEKENEK